MKENIKSIEVEVIDEMLLTGFDFDYSVLIKPNYNFDNEKTIK
jgi:hypothetical protein